METDELCPYHEEFSLSPEQKKALQEHNARIEEERRKRNICIVHFCNTCCLDTEMSLTDADVERVRNLGYLDFFEEVDGNHFLRNIDNRCFFLDGKRCKIYEDRPEGCRFYPFILSKEGAIVDKDCPHGDEFRMRFNPGIEMGLVELVDRLEEERLEGEENQENQEYVT